VVRLKIGDPFLFGRGGEEILQFRQYGVEPKVRTPRHQATPQSRAGHWLTY
jgi:precorrin-4 methylase